MAQQIWKYVSVTLFIIIALLVGIQQQGKLEANATRGVGEVRVTRQIVTPPPLPAAMTFAGEPVPLHLPDVAERLDRELLVNSYLHATTLLGLKRMQRYVPEIEATLKENGIPEDFIYLALAESLFGHVTSHAGAAGFWQLMPETARGYGLIVNSEVDERFHVRKSTMAAIRYLKSAKSKFGSWTDAAASYNRGMGGIDRALERQGVKSYYDLHLNDETSRYIFRILALKEIMGNPHKYGFEIGRENGYHPLPTRQLTVNSTITDLPEFALKQGINYKTLRYYNPWIKGYHLTVPNGREFVLELPK